MKTNILTLLITALLLSACYTTQNFSLSPNEPVNSFWSDGKLYSYEELDSVIVSIGFDSHKNGELIFDLAIDNRTDSIIEFDPSEIYAFSYKSDMDAVMAYRPTSTNSVIDSLTDRRQQEEKRVKRNNALGVLLGVAVIVAAVAIAASSDTETDVDDDLIESSGTFFEMSDDDSSPAIDEIEWNKYYWEHEVMQKSVIESKNIKMGKIHLRIPESPKYKIYIPVNNRVYGFSFTPQQ